MVICHSSTSSPSIQCNACCAAMVGCKPLDRKLGHLGQVGGKPNLCVQSILSALELLIDYVHINIYKLFCKCFFLLLNSIGKTFALELFPYVFAWNKASTVPLFITTLESPFVAKWIRIIWSDTHSFNVTNKTFHLTAS